MRKSGFLVAYFALIVLSASTVFGQGFVGSGVETAASGGQTVTVAEAKALPDNSLVILTGSIVKSLGYEKYTFRDATGDITIDVDRELWKLLDLTVKAADRVEIRGEIDAEKRAVEVDVKYLKKLD